MRRFILKFDSYQPNLSQLLAFCEQTKTQYAYKVFICDYFTLFLCYLRVIIVTHGVRSEANYLLCLVEN